MSRLGRVAVLAGGTVDLPAAPRLDLRVPRDAKPLCDVPVDIPAMEALREQLRLGLADSAETDRWMRHLGLASPEETRSLLRSHLDELSRLFRVTRRNAHERGYIRPRYVRDGSGTLRAVGANLQDAPAVIQGAAMRGLWSYRIAAPVATIVYHLAQPRGSALPTLEQHTKSPTAARASLERIGREVGLCPPAVAQCLDAVVYGLRIPEPEESRVLVDVVGAGGARRLSSHPGFRALRHELLKARGRVLWSARLSRGRVILNDAGRPISASATSGDKLRHLVQGVVVRVLEAITARFPHAVSLPLPDGIVATQRLNVAELDQIAKAASGLDVRFEEELLALDLPLRYSSARVPGRRPSPSSSAVAQAPVKAAA